VLSLTPYCSATTYIFVSARLAATISRTTSSYYFGADGRWHGRVSIGLKPDGSPDRRHVSGQERDIVLDKIAKLEALRDSGKAIGPSHVPTVASWMRTWLDSIAARTAQQSTVDEIYRPKVERWIIPALGRHRLDRLRPQHLDTFYTACRAAGLSSKSVLLLHQIISRALKTALRRELVQRNVATLIDAPAHRDTEIEPLSVTEARPLLDIAGARRNGARWANSSRYSPGLHRSMTANCSSGLRLIAGLHIRPLFYSRVWQLPVTARTISKPTCRKLPGGKRLFRAHAFAHFRSLKEKSKYGAVASNSRYSSNPFVILAECTEVKGEAKRDRREMVWVECVLQRRLPQ